jgi:flagellar basal body rod protein FlgC
LPGLWLLRIQLGEGRSTVASVLALRPCVQSRASRRRGVSMNLADVMREVDRDEKPVRDQGASLSVEMEAVIASGLTRAASWAILLAIRHHQRRNTDPDAPAAISVEDLIAQTGYVRASVYNALHELSARGMIEIQSGGGRHHKSSYRMTDHRSWR